MSLGTGTTMEFVAKELSTLEIKDKRLLKRAQIILEGLQKKLCSTVNRLFLSPQEARQAYDFFFKP